MIGAELAAAQAAGAFVQLVRRGRAERYTNGFVHGVGADLVLVHQFHNFIDDGWIILPIADVAAVERGEREALFERALRGEQIATAPPPFPIALSSFAAVLRSIEAAAAPLIVESLPDPADLDPDADPDDPDFYLGVIAVLGDAHLTLDEVGTDGEWSTPEPIALSRILQVQLGTHYLRTFLAHAAPATAT
ncbi:MAG: hypothetical protein K8W52_33390 [Deltaproteobacteria bacterium]|nr:hypothetical protein [Deltaproteobacteria bacterium]